MEFEIQAVIDWYNENKDWLLIPACISIGVVLVGLILILLTGGGAGFLLKMTLTLILVLAPFGGFFLGDYIDPYLGPVADMIKDKLSSSFAKH